MAQLFTGARRRLLAVKLYSYRGVCSLSAMLGHLRRLQNASNLDLFLDMS